LPRYWFDEDQQEIFAYFAQPASNFFVRTCKC